MGKGRGERRPGVARLPLLHLDQPGQQRLRAPAEHGWTCRCCQPPSTSEGGGGHSRGGGGGQRGRRGWQLGAAGGAAGGASLPPPTPLTHTHPPHRARTRRYDESNHERFPPGDVSKRAFSYFVLTGGRFIYAAAIRLIVLKFVLSMTATKDVLALANLEVRAGVWCARGGVALPAVKGAGVRDQKRWGGWPGVKEVGRLARGQRGGAAGRPVASCAAQRRGTLWGLTLLLHCSPPPPLPLFHPRRLTCPTWRRGRL